MKISAKDARALMGDKYPGKKKQPAGMSKVQFDAAYRFREESAERRPAKDPCWHALVFAGGRYFCAEGCDE